MGSREQVIEKLRALLPELRVRYGVTRLALFGSFARDEGGPDSDVDLLVDFERTPGFAFVTLSEEIEELLARRVDLVTFERLRTGLESDRYRERALRIQEELTDVVDEA